MKRTTHKTRRLVCLLLALVLVLSVFAGLTLFASAAPALPTANSKARHIDCTSLSTQAVSYYGSGQYSYAQMSQLSGVNNAEDCWATTQNNPLYTRLQTLMTSTHSNTTSYSGTSAGSLAYYWVRTDAQSSSSTYYCFYSDLLYGSSGFPSDMQREHIWPKSNASFYQTNGGSDLHHLRPSVGSLNNSKSNKTFGEMTHDSSNTKYVVSGDASTVYYSGTYFEPKDDVKGDVARILLYVYCRWGQPNLYTDVASNKLPTMDSDDSQNNGTRAIDSRDILLKWMKNDPVDTWEMERNDRVQDVQGNRNVFIDYPEYAWLVFGLTPPSDMTTPSGMAASGATNYTVTATSNNTSYGTVSVSGYTITASPKTGYYAAGYNVTSGTATVSQSGNTFTVSPSSNCTVQIVFAKAQSYTVTYIANNSTYSTATAYGGDSITLPSSATNVSGWTFVGWTDNAGYADGTSEPVNFYEKGGSYTVSGSVTLYAVYTQTSGSGGESTATVTFADLGLENGVQYSDPFDGGDFTVTFSGGGNDGKYYTTGTGIRVYGGGTMTVAAKSGTITSIKITCASGNVIVAGTSDVGTLTVSGTVGTWTGDAASVAFTRASGSGHWRIQSVEATVSGGGSTTYSINPTNAQHTHELAYNAAVAATCGAEGHSAYYYCAGCGKYFSDAQGNNEITLASTVIAATGNHSYGAWTQNDANTHQRTCSVCGDVETSAHSFTDIVTAPTATKQGYTTHSCELCGYSYNDTYTDAIGFVAEDGILYKRADTVTAGDKIVIATNYSGDYEAASFIANGSALAANAVTVSGNILTPVNTTAVFTVQSIGGDATVYYLVTEDGRYLTASSGTALTLSDTASDFSKWLLVPQDGQSTFVLQVYTRSYALEYYNGTFRNSVYNAPSVTSAQQMAIFKRTEAETYTVSYRVPTGVTTPAAATCGEGESVILPTAAAPEGWTFSGWVTDEYDNVVTAPATIYTGSFTPEASTVLYALYTKTETTGTGGDPVTTYELVDSADNVTAGTYVITWDNSLYLPSETAKSPNPAVGSGITVSDGKLTNAVTDDMKWTFTGNNTDGFAVTHTAGSTTYYLGASNAAQGITVDTTGTTSGKSYSWKAIDDSTNGMLLRCSDGGSRNLAVYNSGSWRYYATGNYYSGTLRLYKQTTTPGSGSTTVTYTTKFAADCDHDQLTAVPAAAATCTEAGNSAYWRCDDCGKYFSDAAGENEIAENSWVIPATGHAYGVWTSNGDGTHTRVCDNDASHTESASCSFTGVETKPATYTETGVMTYTCADCGYSYTETIPVLTVSTSGAYKLASTGLQDGDKVILYNAGNGMAVKAEMSSYYVAGLAVTPVDNQITDPDSGIVWTVTLNSDGTYTFRNGDNVLAVGQTTSGTRTYTNLYLTETDHEIKWTPGDCNAENNSYYLTAEDLTASYDNIYLEWYGNKTAFSAYDTSASNATETNFGFQFYVLNETPVVCGSNLTLKGEIDTNAYIAIPDSLVEDGVYYVMDGGDPVQITSAMQQSNGLYKFTKAMPAKNMDTVVEVGLQDADGNPIALKDEEGNELPTSTYSFSVQAYLQTVINDTEGTYSDELVALCEAMSDYGYYAQLEQNYNKPSDAAGEASWREGIESKLIHPADVAAVNSNGIGDVSSQATGTATFYGASLLMKSKTTLRCYFKLSGTDSSTGYTITVDGNPVEATLTRYKTTNYYYYDYSDIAAKNLGDAHTIVISNGTNTVTVNNLSAYSYVKDVIDNETDNQDLINVCKALRLYGDKTEAYFEAQSN